MLIRGRMEMDVHKPQKIDLAVESLFNLRCHPVTLGYTHRAIYTDRQVNDQVGTKAVGSDILYPADFRKIDQDRTHIFI